LRKKTVEDYLELLYDLQKNKKIVHTNDIASSLNIKPSSVTEVFQKLCDKGYINYEKYSGVTLTKKGKKIALDTKKKHKKIAEFLVLLGVDKKTAESDACEMEHILHPKTMDKIVEFVDVVKRSKHPSETFKIGKK
jgi:DtxR family Mn-dependent transcriptional regulator